MSGASWHRAGPLPLLQPDPPSMAASPSNCRFERLPAGSAKTPRKASFETAWWKARLARTYSSTRYLRRRGCPASLSGTPWQASFKAEFRTKPGGPPGIRPRRETAASRRCRKGRAGGGRLTTTRRIRRDAAPAGREQPGITGKIHSLLHRNH